MTIYIMFFLHLVDYSFDLLVPTMSNRSTCTQVQDLPQNYCGDNGKTIKKKAFRHFSLSILFFTILFVLLHLQIHSVLRLIQSI